MNYFTKTFKLVLSFCIMTVICQAQTATPVPAVAPAPDTTKKDVPLSITGGVDVYYRGSGSSAPSKTAYTSAVNAFQLGTANVVIAKDLGKIGFTADLYFGQRAQETNYNYPVTTTLSPLKQLFVTYKPSDKLKFTLGEFTTFFDYELIEAYNNLNYSTSYTFSNGPFFHTGIKMEYAFTSKFSGLIGVFDVTDTKGFSDNKHIGAQLAYVDGPFKGYLNFLNGTGLDSANNSNVNFVGSYQVTPKFGVGLNLEYKSSSPNAKISSTSTSWTGVGLYLNYAISDKFLLALRGENFDDTKGLAGYGTTMNEFTLSGNIKVDALTFIPEIRFDSAGDNKKLFNGSTTDFSYLLAAVYKF